MFLSKFLLVKLVEELMDILSVSTKFPLIWVNNLKYTPKQDAHFLGRIKVARNKSVISMS